jgi:hypothetical protein
MTPEQGFCDPVDTLWLLSRFKHHVFNNSSFYWWGAWLSRANHLTYTQMIRCSDNFINPDSFPPSWKKF